MISCWWKIGSRREGQDQLRSTPLLCLNSGSASFEGPGLCGLRRRVLCRDPVNCVSCCEMGRSSLRSISWLRHQIFFYPCVKTSAAPAHVGDDLRHVMSPFSLFPFSFSGTQRILEYVRPRRIVAIHPPKQGKEGCIWRSWDSDWDSLRAA